jgi:hypothetical protein
MDATLIGSLATFIIILALLVTLRTKNDKLEIKSGDAVVAVLPVAMFLLVTGKIQRFEMGELKIETAFARASTSAITPQIAPLSGLPSEPLNTDPKRGIDEIPRLIEKRTQGLLFRLGQGNYYGPAIMEYLTLLTRQPFLRYIVIDNEDRSFFAMADARGLVELLTSERPPYTANDFARWLNLPDKAALKRLPGFLSSDDAVTDEADKRQALQRMESLNVDTLPVIAKNKSFVGTVNRSRLTASLILDVANGIK